MTLKEIAKEAGVSISTVSRIINGNSPNAASKEMQDKIWSIARAGGYVPNTSAQALRQKPESYAKHPAIACIYARSQDAQNDAFFSALTRSIEQEALKEGYIVKYSFSAYNIHNPATYSQIIYTGLNPLDADYDQVICAGNAVASDAVKHLISLGHKKIGYIGETKNEIRNLYLSNKIVCFSSSSVCICFFCVCMNSFAFSKLCMRISLSTLSLIGDSSGVCDGGIKFLYSSF